MKQKKVWLLLWMCFFLLCPLWTVHAEEEIPEEEIVEVMEEEEIEEENPPEEITEELEEVEVVEEVEEQPTSTTEEPSSQGGVTVVTKQWVYENLSLVIDEVKGIEWAGGGNWKKAGIVKKGEVRTFDFPDVGTYRGDRVGVKLTVEPTQGVLEVFDVFQRGAVAHDGSWGEKVAGIGYVTYEFYRMDDPTKTPFPLENSYITFGSLLTWDAKLDTEYIGNGIDNNSTVYVSEDSVLKSRTVNGYTVYGGGLDGNDYVDSPTHPTYSRGTAAFPISATAMRFIYYGIGGFWFTPSTYTFNYPMPKYTITTEVINGTIDPDITNIPQYEDRTVTYQPNEGYVLDYIEVDGEVVEDVKDVVEEYPFQKITEDHHIKVVYMKKPTILKQALDSNGNDYTRGMVKENGIYTYQITVTQEGETDKKVTIMDSLPEGMEYVSSSDEGIYEEGKVTWNVVVPAESSKSVTVQVKIAEGKAGEVLTNQASYQYLTWEEEVEVETPVLIPPIKDVQNKKGESIDHTLVGIQEELTYVIMVENPANDPKDYVIEDVLTSEVEFVSAGQDGTFENGLVHWTTTFEPKEKKEFTFIVKTLKEGSTIPNTATVYVDQVQDNTNTVINWTPKAPIKQVWQNDQEVTGKIVPIDSKLRYEIIVENNTDLENTYTLRDLLPENTKYDSIEEGTYQNGVSTWTFTLKPHEKRSLYWTVQTVGKGVKIQNIAYLNVNEIKDIPSNVVRNETQIIIDTKAYNSKDGYSNVSPEKKSYITDVIYYEDAEPGAWYEVVGVLHTINDQGWDMGPANIDGYQVYVSKWFEAPSKSGSVEIQYVFDGTKLENQKVNSFITMKKGKQVVSTHASPEHTQQEITIQKAPAKKERRADWIQTGTGKNTILFGGLGTLALCGLVLLKLTAKPRKK